MTGGIAGRDSIPAMLMPGEFVVPTRNFEETVNAVARSRAVESIVEADTAGITQAPIQVMIGFEGAEASQVLTARQNEDRSLGISRENV